MEEEEEEEEEEEHPFANSITTSTQNIMTIIIQTHEIIIDIH